MNLTLSTLFFTVSTEEKTLFNTGTWSGLGKILNSSTPETKKEVEIARNFLVAELKSGERVKALYSPLL